MDRYELSKRAAMRLMAGAALLPALPTGLRAQTKDDYPNRLVELVVGFAAGGQSDILGRKLALQLSKELNGNFVVLNKEGASSTIAARYVTTSKPDGYTILLGGGSGMIMAPLVMKVPFDPVKDFRSISLLTTAALCISVHPSVPAKDLNELVALIKKNPDKYSYATSGAGGSDHLTGELFKQAAGDLPLLHVPYRGAAPAATSVMGGEVPILVSTLSSIYPYHTAGQLRMLVMTGEKRNASAPEIPTAVEQGFTDLVAETSNFLTVAAAAPKEVVAKLFDATSKIMSRSAFLDELRAAQFDPVTGSSPEATDAYIAREVVKWRRVVERAKLSIQ